MDLRPGIKITPDMLASGESNQVVSSNIGLQSGMKITPDMLLEGSIPQVQEQPIQVPDFMKPTVGFLENAANQVTQLGAMTVGLVPNAIGSVGGELVDSVVNQRMPTIDNIAKRMEAGTELMDKVTYQPKTESGLRGQEVIHDVLMAVPKAVDAVDDLTGQNFKINFPNLYAATQAAGELGPFMILAKGVHAGLPAKPIANPVLNDRLNFPEQVVEEGRPLEPSVAAPLEATPDMTSIAQTVAAMVESPVLSKTEQAAKTVERINEIQAKLSEIDPATASEELLGEAAKLQAVKERLEKSYSNIADELGGESSPIEIAQQDTIQNSKSILDPAMQVEKANEVVRGMIDHFATETGDSLVYQSPKLLAQGNFIEDLLISSGIKSKVALLDITDIENSTMPDGDVLALKQRLTDTKNFGVVKEVRDGDGRSRWIAVVNSPEILKGRGSADTMRMTEAAIHEAFGHVVVGERYSWASEETKLALEKDFQRYTKLPADEATKAFYPLKTGEIAIGVPEFGRGTTDMAVPGRLNFNAVKEGQSVELGWLRPAVRDSEGRVATARTTDTHYDAAEKLDRNVEPGKAVVGRGYITPDGKFLSVEEAANWVKTNQPDVYRHIPREVRGELDSTDYLDALNEEYSPKDMALSGKGGSLDTHFKEWLVNGITKWATSEAEPIGLANKWFKKLADAFKKAFKKEGAAQTPESIKAWMNSMFDSSRLADKAESEQPLKIVESHGGYKKVSITKQLEKLKAVVKPEDIKAYEVGKIEGKDETHLGIYKKDSSGNKVLINQIKSTSRSSAQREANLFKYAHALASRGLSEPLTASGARVKFYREMLSSFKDEVQRISEEQGQSFEQTWLEFIGDTNTFSGFVSLKDKYLNMSLPGRKIFDRLLKIAEHNPSALRKAILYEKRVIPKEVLELEKAEAVLKEEIAEATIEQPKQVTVQNLNLNFEDRIRNAAQESAFSLIKVGSKVNLERITNSVIEKLRLSGKDARDAKKFIKENYESLRDGKPVESSIVEEVNKNIERQRVPDEVSLEEAQAYMDGLSDMMVARKDKEYETNLKRWAATTNKQDGYSGEFETGKSVLIESAFHGTTAKLRRFSDSMLGSLTNAMSAKEWHFFAADAPTAYGYAFATSARDFRRLYKARTKLDDVHSRLDKEVDELSKQRQDQWNSMTEDERADNLDAINSRRLRQMKISEQLSRIQAKLDKLPSGDYNESLLDGEGMAVPQGSNILPLYIRMKNPLVYDFEGKGYREVTYYEVIKQAKAEGRDGVIFKNTRDPGIDLEMLEDTGVDVTQYYAENTNIFATTNFNVKSRFNSGKFEEGTDISNMAVRRKSKPITGPLYEKINKIKKKKETTPEQASEKIKKRLAKEAEFVKETSKLEEAANKANVSLTEYLRAVGKDKDGNPLSEDTIAKILRKYQRLAKTIFTDQEHILRLGTALGLVDGVTGVAGLEAYIKTVFPKAQGPLKQLTITGRDILMKRMQDRWFELEGQKFDFSKIKTFRELVNLSREERASLSGWKKFKAGLAYYINQNVDEIATTPAGSSLVHLLRNVLNSEAALYTRDYPARLQAIMEKVTDPKDREHILDVYEGKAVARNKVFQEGADLMREIYHAYGTEMERLGVRIQYKGGYTSEFKFDPNANHYPHMWEPGSFDKPSEKMLNSLLVSGQPVDAKQATAIIKSYGNRATRLAAPKFANLEMAREIEMDGYIRDPLKVTMQYLMSGAKRLAILREVGQQPEVRLAQLAWDHFQQSGDADSYNFAVKVINSITGVPIHERLMEKSGWMANPLEFAALASTLQHSAFVQPGVLANTITVAGFKRTAEGIRRYIRADPRKKQMSKEWAETLGANGRSVTKELLDEMHDSLSLATKMDKLMHFWRIPQVDTFFRNSATLTGRLHINEMVERAINLGDKKAEQELRRLGLSSAKFKELLESGKDELVEDELRKGAYAFAQRTNLVNDALTKAQWTMEHSSFSRMLTLLGRFSFQQHHFLKSLYKDDPKKLVKYLGVASAIGVPGYVAKTLMKGKNPIEDAKERGLFGTWIAMLQNAAGLGMFMDMTLDGLTQVVTGKQGHAADRVGGPLPGLAKDTLVGASKVAHGELSSAAAMRLLLRSGVVVSAGALPPKYGVPIAGTLGLARPAIETFVKENK